jgi:RNA polymerase sigma-70 factor, ECF subfamily
LPTCPPPKNFGRFAVLNQGLEGAIRVEACLPVVFFLVRSTIVSDAVDPDAQLMLQVKNGDITAFERLVDKYKQPVLNLINRTLTDPTEAEDLAQNVFVQVFRSASRYQHTARFTTWLYTITRNLCLNEIRRRSRHPAESLDGLGEDTEDHPARQYEDPKSHSADAHLLSDELVYKVEEALSDLPEKQRTAILLFQEKDMSYEEISIILNCSLSATKSLIHRGRETLKLRLKPYLQSGTWRPASKQEQL